MGARIVIDARTISSSSGRYVYKLLDNLQTIDKVNDYHVLLRPQDLNYWQPKSSNWKIEPAPFDDFSLQEQLGLSKLLNHLKPDLVHFCFPQHPILYRGRFVVTVHDLTMIHQGCRMNNLFVHPNLLKYIKRVIFHKVFKRAVKRSELIITPTDYVKKDLINRFKPNPDKIVRVYEAADKLISLPPHPIEALRDKSFILSVNNGLPHKNNQRLLEAHQQLLAKHPKLHLVFTGRLNNDQKRLMTRAETQNLKQVIFTGFVEDDQLAWAYQQAQAYIFPSLSEGFGLPGLEAMKFGTPVVSSNATCLPEVYGKAAHYFDPLDIHDMVRAIGDVLSDHKLRQQLIATSANQVEQYSWSKTAQETLAVYKRALPW